MVKSILIFRTGHLGDTLVAMPAIHAIKKIYPHHQFFLLTERNPDKINFVSSWDILKPTGWFDDVILYKPAKSPWNSAKMIISLSLKLRSLSVESVYDLSPERTPKQYRRDYFFFKYLAGIHTYHGYGVYIKPQRKKDGTLPRLLPEWKRLQHIVDRIENEIFHFPIPDNERREVQNIFKEEGVKHTKKLLAVGPSSKRPSRRWPFQRFAELGCRLLETFPDMELIILGGKEDAIMGDELRTRWGTRAHNFAGKLSIYGSAAALECCTAYVGNDTGTMHLAGIVGKPCVALFSAADYPGIWEPFGDNHIFLRHETECAGCMLQVCNSNNKCMNLISVEEVYNAVSKVINNSVRNNG